VFDVNPDPEGFAGQTSITVAQYHAVGADPVRGRPRMYRWPGCWASQRVGHRLPGEAGSSRAEDTVEAWTFW
jgi:hypothetical protein